MLPLTSVSSLHHTPFTLPQDHAASAQGSALQQSAPLPMVKIDQVDVSVQREEDVYTHWDSPPPSYVESPR